MMLALPLPGVWCELREWVTKSRNLGLRLELESLDWLAGQPVGRAWPAR